MGLIVFDRVYGWGKDGVLGGRGGVFITMYPSIQAHERVVSELTIELNFTLVPDSTTGLVRRSLCSYSLSATCFIVYTRCGFEGSPIAGRELCRVTTENLYIVINIQSLPQRCRFVARTFCPRSV